MSNPLDRIDVDVKSRLIVLSGEICDTLATEFVRGFAEISLTPGEIDIIITGSPGGDYDGAALGMCEIVGNSKYLINIYGQGMVASSAALLFSYGDRRIIAKNSYLMFHEGTIFLEDSPGKLKVLDKVMDQMSKNIYDHLSEITNKPPSYFKENHKTDWYIFSVTAVEIGLATRVGTYGGMS